MGLFLFACLFVFHLDVGFEILNGFVNYDSVWL